MLAASTNLENINDLNLQENCIDNMDLEDLVAAKHLTNLILLYLSLNYIDDEALITIAKPNTLIKQLTT